MPAKINPFSEVTKKRHFFAHKKVKADEFYLHQPSLVKSDKP